MSFSLFFTYFVSALMAVFCIAAWILSRKGKRTYEKLARTSTYHCMRCDSIYTASPDLKVASCPKCGYKNSKLKF